MNGEFWFSGRMEIWLAHERERRKWQLVKGGKKVAKGGEDTKRRN